MSCQIMCRCCLLRPPDKDLESAYRVLGKNEVYADMLKECFEIHITIGHCKGDGGICEVCIMRLRDAAIFKDQVRECQKEFQVQLANGTLKDSTGIKQEIFDISDDDDYKDINFAMKDEIDYGVSDAEDDKRLVEMLGSNNVTVKRKGVKTEDRKPKKIVSQSKIGLKVLPAKPKVQIVLPAKPIGQIVFSRNNRSREETNIFNILQHSNCLPFNNKTIAGIICAYCKTIFKTVAELRTHTDQHTDVKKLDVDFSRGNLVLKVDITDLKCKNCNFPANRIADLKAHLSTVHKVRFYNEIKDYFVEFKLSDGEILNCALCSSTFETFKMLLQHMNRHYRNFICEVCDMGFINKHRLRSHRRTHETGNFKCSYCDKIFTTPVKKACHEKFIHKTLNRYKTACPICNETFSNYYQRNMHMFQEHQTVAATYKCNSCDKLFIMKSKLTAHIKKEHLMERNHMCAICGQGFFQKKCLDDHMVKHNGERIHKCDVCSKSYARKKTLREHMRIHNNDRRFKCSVCSLTFVQKCSMKSHMLSNHGVALTDQEQIGGKISGGVRIYT